MFLWLADVVLVVDAGTKKQRISFMKVGDLVFELPLGKEWFKNNPWLHNNEIGIVTKVIDRNTVDVLWPTGIVSSMQLQYLERYNESR